MNDLKYYASNRWNTNQTRYVMEGMGAFPFFNDEKSKIITHIDQWGFRSSLTSDGKYHNIDLNNSRDLAFGCSKTFGFELDHKDTWPYMMNLTNFGVSGGSMQTVARLAEAWIPKLKPEKIYVQEPAPDRREILYSSGETYLHLLQSTLLYICPLLFPEYKEHLMSTGLNHKSKSLTAFCKKFPEYDVLNMEKNLEISAEAKARIEKVCADNDVRIIFMFFEEQPEIIGKARDGMHPDERWNRKIVKKFKELEENI